MKTIYSNYTSKLQYIQEVMRHFLLSLFIIIEIIQTLSFIILTIKSTLLLLGQLIEVSNSKMMLSLNPRVTIV